MHRSLSLSLSLSGVAALALANAPLLPAAAQDADTAEDLGGVMSISLKDVLKPTLGFQGALLVLLLRAAVGSFSFAALQMAIKTRVWRAAITAFRVL